MPTGIGRCSCGCGEPVKQRRNKWIKGHNSRKPEYAVPKLCACGCGEVAPKYHRFVRHHHLRGKVPHNKVVAPLPACQCGCGQPVKKHGRRFLWGHAIRLLDREEWIRRLGTGHTGYPHDEEARRLMRRTKLTTGLGVPPTRYEKQVMDALEEHGIPFSFNTAVAQICIPDFSFPDARLVLQIDGSTHNKAEQRRKDLTQDFLLEGAGWKVVRWSNARVVSNLPELMREFVLLYRSRLTMV